MILTCFVLPCVSFSLVLLFFYFSLSFLFKEKKASNSHIYTLRLKKEVNANDVIQLNLFVRSNEFIYRKYTLAMIYARIGQFDGF